MSGNPSNEVSPSESHIISIGSSWIQVNSLFYVLFDQASVLLEWFGFRDSQVTHLFVREEYQQVSGSHPHIHATIHIETSDASD